MDISENMQAPYEGKSSGRPASGKGHKLPWLKFYTDDWRKDSQLGMCSLAARGLWIDIICLMHRSEQPGFLLVSGMKPTLNQLSILVRADRKAVEKGLFELRNLQVFSEDDRGVIYSRRMVADYAKSLIDKQNGATGGNPNLIKDDRMGVNPQDNQPVNAGINLADKAQNTESINQNHKEGIKTIDSSNRAARSAKGRGDDDGFEEFWSAYPRKVGKGDAVKAFALALKKVSAAEILRALKQHTFSPEQKFIKHPARWLKGEHWLDEAAAPAVSANDQRLSELANGFAGLPSHTPQDFFSGQTLEGDFSHV